MLGGQVIGYEAGEIGALILTAITAKMTWQQLRDVPFAHPTLSESINKMLNEVEDES
jgi:pyruvate/2-oxoglutarate dehydrogenase complex dihydrolipoamide dehydrogenase (E3) component